MGWDGSKIVLLSPGAWPLALCQVCGLILIYLIIRILLARMPFSTDEPTSKETVGRDVKGAASVAAAKFAMGMTVRVKRGTLDRDGADFSIGGWTGAIEGIGPDVESRVYLVHWNQETLDKMSADYRRRFQIDDIGIERSWLGEEDLESPPKPDLQTGFYERGKSASEIQRNN
jgi:hypothetical protein